VLPASFLLRRLHGGARAVARCYLPHFCCGGSLRTWRHENIVKILVRSEKEAARMCSNGSRGVLR
jgi:hypothetical protein